MTNEKFLTEMDAAAEVVGRLPEGVEAIGVIFDGTVPYEKKRHTIVQVHGDLVEYAEAVGLKVSQDMTRITGELWEETYAQEINDVVLLLMKRVEP